MAAQSLPEPLHILIPADVFPPGSVGGAAWSAYTLARALIERGHQVTVVVPVQGQPGCQQRDDLGVPVVQWGYRAPRIPFVQNYFRHEALWSPLAKLLISLGRELPPTRWLIHAQHVQTTPAAVLAGQQVRVPVVATVRDHWPWDYFATGLHGNRFPYRHTRWTSLATDLPARLGGLPGALALPAIPYMLAHLRQRAAFLAQADAVIAVSRYMARRLATIVPAARIHVIPNMVDQLETDRITTVPPETPLPGPFLLFVGKLERNKGAGLLVEIFRALAQQENQTVNGEQSGLRTLVPPHASPSAERVPYTLVIAGNGALQSEIEQGLAELGVQTRFLAWAPHDEVLRLMARCELLLFPSAWGEPLSRVLLEASMTGAPILAMPTGGTPDIITNGVNGVLAATAETFAQQLALLLKHPAERQRLGEAVRRMARQRFAVEVVAPQVEALYEQVFRIP